MLAATHATPVYNKRHLFNKPGNCAVSEPDCDIRDLLNAQTGRIGWNELQRHFARGAVLHVDNNLDLIEVAATVVEDNTAQLKVWLDSSAVGKASVEHAREWEAKQTEFWAVVAAPWVLVQEKRQR